MAARLPGAVNAWVERVGRAVGTGMGVGMFPVAPATAASFVAVVVLYLLPIATDSPAFFGMVAASLVVGPWACGSLISAEDHDPKRAVWDEVAGIWLTCLLLPKSLPWLAAAFVLFRVLDVLKPWPIRRFERLPGGWGIMADDAVAGVIGAVALNLIYRLAW